LFSLLAKTLAFHNNKIAKILEILMITCKRGEFKTWSRLFLQLVDVFAIIFATSLSNFDAKSESFRENTK
jgi:hypothetical protein